MQKTITVTFGSREAAVKALESPILIETPDGKIEVMLAGDISEIAWLTRQRPGDGQRIKEG